MAGNHGSSPSGRPQIALEFLIGCEYRRIASVLAGALRGWVLDHPSQIGRPSRLASTPWARAFFHSLGQSRPGIPVSSKNRQSRTPALRSRSPQPSTLAL